MTGLRSRIHNGEVLYGMSINFASPDAVELGAIAGFDFVTFDGEHGPLDLGALTAMARAADARGLPAVARPPNASPDTILRFLDIGLLGVMVPQVGNADSARRIVNAVKYPPSGSRGLGIVRANRWGDDDPAEYTIRANDETVVMTLIESIDAVDQIDRILEVEGVDVAWIGPTDLSQSLGHQGRTDHPEVWSAIERICVAARKAGRASAVGVGNAAAAARYLDLGVTCFAMQARTLLITGGRQFLTEVRRLPRSEAT